MADGVAAPSGIGGVMKFFGRKPGQSLSDFKKEEWDKLTDQDKADLAQGIGDGTFTY